MPFDDGAFDVVTLHPYTGKPKNVVRIVKIVRREMAGAFEMDPPLEVDLGVGENWLEAK